MLFGCISKRQAGLENMLIFWMCCLHTHFPIMLPIECSLLRAKQRPWVLWLSEPICIMLWERQFVFSAVGDRLFRLYNCRCGLSLELRFWQIDGDHIVVNLYEILLLLWLYPLHENFATAKMKLQFLFCL
jgi:hypothetical protein